MAFQDFDAISERVKYERKRKIKKRITIAVISILVVAAIAAAVFLIVQHGSNAKYSSSKVKDSGLSTKEISASHKAIQSVCEKTDYKERCLTSLEQVVEEDPKRAQPKEFLATAITVVYDELDKAVKQIPDIKFDSKEKKKAFDVCKQVLQDAKEELNCSISAVEGKDLETLSSKTPDLNNWLSAVVSYQQTCFDAMPEGDTKTSVKNVLQNAEELTSNSLAIVAQISSILAAFGVGESSSRRLLSEPETKPASDSLPLLDEENLPMWMDDEDRRVLKGGDIEKPKPNVTVAKDGSGDYKTINGALASMPKSFKGRYVIYVKEGVYDENVIVTKDMKNVTIYGEGSQKSIVSGNKNFKDGVPTFHTATFAAIGEGFLAQSIGFRNTAGPDKNQAVALRVQSDRSIFLNCRIEGYHYTLYVQTHRQYYRGCKILGTIDFIFGDASALFQNCMIYARKPSNNQKITVTAQGRADKRETTGIIIQNSRILADEKLEPEKSKFDSYLGRPWKEFSRTVIMETEIDDLIDPKGWVEWSGDFALSTLYYAEYNNKGPRADVKDRVQWPGYKGKISKDEAEKFTVVAFLQGDDWVKPSKVPVRLGLFT